MSHLIISVMLTLAATLVAKSNLLIRPPWSIVWMLSPAVPFARRKPVFVVREPQRRPRQDCVGDEERWRPLTILRLIKAESTIRIPVRYRLAFRVFA